MRRYTLSDEDLLRFQEKRDPITSVSRELGCSDTTARKLLRSAGVATRPKRPLTARELGWLTWATSQRDLGKSLLEIGLAMYPRISRQAVSQRIEAYEDRRDRFGTVAEPRTAREVLRASRPKRAVDRIQEGLDDALATAEGLVGECGNVV